MSTKQSSQNSNMRILIVDDVEQMRDVLRKFLAAEGYEIETAADGKDALQKYSARAFDLVLSDIKMPSIDGTALMSAILNIDPGACVILMTAFGSIEAAVEAIKNGATDYVSKPFQMDDVLFRVRRALKERRLEDRVAQLETQFKKQAAARKIIGSSPAIKRLKHLIARIAPLDDTVLITGETGTGKELVASALHEASRHNSGPFVPIECSAIPETLIEAELFGHEKGTFTGASESRPGLFEIARDGTLFLDEVETLSLNVQAKLLRVLQEKIFRRVGGRADIQFRARVISATNQNLTEMIDGGKFRRDLYYRLNVLPIEVPSLRDRRDDLPELVAHILAKRSAELKTEKFRISPDALESLSAHEWPGNVRELENVLSYVTALGEELVTAADLPSQIGNSHKRQTAPKSGPAQTLFDIEKQHILQTLETAQGNRIEAARLLGIDRRTLYNKLHQYGFGE